MVKRAHVSQVEELQIQPCTRDVIKARQGKARQGKARQGKVRQGKARQGKARKGDAHLVRKASHTRSESKRRGGAEWGQAGRLDVRAWLTAPKKY